ncbi:integrase catalytic domain-containing protein [Trichonephila clavipes]|nr:integrase catalytic domain-containing protein [Trichonephila clavipes]
MQPLHRLNEVSEKWRRVSSTDGFFFHCPNFDQNRNFFDPGLYTGGVFEKFNLYTARTFNSKNKIEIYGGISVKLVTPKSRVAPLNCVTLPRLELLGALVAARLASKVKKIVNLKRSCLQYHWTDSKIVLFWIKGNKTRWKQLVANRVNEITSLTDPHSWYHCAGKENPAYFLSRGLSADCLVSNSRWRTGAEFLSDSEFPKKFQQVVPELDYLTELEKETVVQKRKKLPEADRSEETVLLNSDSSSILDELLELSNNYFKVINIFCLIFSDSTTTVRISPKRLDL